MLRGVEEGEEDDEDGFASFSKRERKSAKASGGGDEGECWPPPSLPSMREGEEDGLGSLMLARQAYCHGRGAVTMRWAGPLH